MTTIKKGRDQATPKTSDSRKHTTTDPLIGWSASFTPISCDACGKQFTKTQRVYVMAFRPTGAPFEIAYCVCESCYPKMGTDNAATSRALTTAQTRLTMVENRGRDDGQH